MIPVTGAGGKTGTLSTFESVLRVRPIITPHVTLRERSSRPKSLLFLGSETLRYAQDDIIEMSSIFSYLIFSHPFLDCRQFSIQQFCLSISAAHVCRMGILKCLFRPDIAIIVY
jgi:hypothetical protein